MVYYCYRVTAPDGMKYIGHSSCDGEPLDALGHTYFTSGLYSRQEAFRADARAGRMWKREILGMFDCRGEAIELEAELHSIYDVGLNPQYWNGGRSQATWPHGGLTCRCPVCQKTVSPEKGDVHYNQIKSSAETAIKILQDAWAAVHSSGVLREILRPVVKSEHDRKKRDARPAVVHGPGESSAKRPPVVQSDELREIHRPVVMSEHERERREAWSAAVHGPGESSAKRGSVVQEERDRMRRAWEARATNAK